MLLRYPGGKSRGSIRNRIISSIEDRFPGGVFGEIFLGGAGITLSLIEKKLVDNILINEIDPALCNLWNRVIHDRAKLIRRIKTFDPSVEKFYRFKEDLINGDDDGFKFLFVNRASHGGRGVLAGVQGGVKQDGKYVITCRWNVERMESFINKAHSLFSSVKIYGNRCMDLDFENLIDKCDFHYLDPPYWEKGNELYRFSFSDADHHRLYSSLLTHKNWVLSYNNHQNVRKLYNKFPIVTCDTSGNGGNKPKTELLIFSNANPNK